MKRTKGQCAIFAAALLLVVLMGIGMYHNAYSVETDNFPEAARAWLSRGMSRPTAVQVQPRQTLDIGRARWVLAELDDGLDPGPRLGLFQLKRGWNGRYAITRSSSGSGSVRGQVIRSGGQTYYLLCGRNRLFDIREASFTLEKDGGWEKSFRADIPEGDYFLTAVQIDSGAEVRPGSLWLYNAAGEDVTEQAV